ncbi:hypothetical protein [Nostoc sp. WHI]|uniref:hypothetical protein n=1 Tax=Nostoc sp. WHI TaxID=2650611 RepID=UPI0018C48E07|nr:hypothetical protein [Nostoc sp. WHI]MBG1267205.1 hypothetical protein [Nostoc sp. WHI]
MTSFNINLYLFLKNLVFFVIATFFNLVSSLWLEMLAHCGSAASLEAAALPLGIPSRRLGTRQRGKHTKPYTLPLPLAAWYKVWFLSVQLLGGLLPLVVMLLWGVWWSIGVNLS